MSKLRNMKKETILELVFLLSLFVFYFLWARIQPLSGPPDEHMRYSVAQYIYENGALPRGDDPAVRDATWGISYAFSPVLAYMFSAAFMKLMSVVSTAPFALLMAARCVNMLLGTATAFVVLRIGRKLFSPHKAWFLAAFVCLLPESVYIFSYVNCDGLAVFSSALILYGWILGWQQGWTVKNCVLLSVGLGLCGLSYYNAYGFILCSILFFGSLLLMEAHQKRDWGFFAKRGALVCVLVLAMVSWWFIRNALLYDWDFLGRNASALCAEMYAKSAYKPSLKTIPVNSGISFREMLTEGFHDMSMGWLELTARSFVGRFGHFTVCLPGWLEDNYLDFMKVGLLLVLLHPVRIFALRDRDGWRKSGIFHWCMLLAMLIPNFLNAYYSYYSDYQPQGRYSLPMLIPLGYFLVVGYGHLFDAVIEKESVRRAVYTGICALMAVVVIFVYFGIFWPAYREVPFGIGAFLAGA